MRKLGIKPGHEVVLAGAPAGWSVGDLPDGVRLRHRPPGTPVDLIVAFFGRLVRLEKAVPDLAGRIVPDGALWIAWPRRAGGHSSDITENDIRATVLPLGLVDVKVAALDEDWSGLKTVWRRELRPGLRR